MADEYIVDAHTLIWYVENSPRLGPDAGRVLDDPASVLILPITALAEACWVIERGRCSIPSAAVLLADVDADPRISLLPLDREILDISLTLTAVREMHDRQIVATALCRQRAGATVALLTRDVNLVSSGLVPIIW